MTQNNIVRYYVGLKINERNNESDEDLPIHKDEVIQFLDEKEEIEGFTIQESQGYWKGEVEDSVVIEIVNPSVTNESLQKELAEEFKQESVMMVELKGNVVF